MRLVIASLIALSLITPSLAGNAPPEGKTWQCGSERPTRTHN